MWPFGLALLAAGGFSWSCVPGLSSVLRSLPSLSQFHVLLSQAILFFRELQPCEFNIAWPLRFFSYTVIPKVCNFHVCKASTAPGGEHRVCANAHCPECLGSGIVMRRIWETSVLGPVTRMPMLGSSQGTICQLCFHNHTLNLSWVWPGRFPLGPPGSWSCLK